MPDVLIEENLMLTLNAAPGLAALVADRITPGSLPQASTLPAVTYFGVSTERILTHDGYSGLAFPRYQFDCWAAAYVIAKRVAREVRRALVRPSAGGFEVMEHDDQESGVLNGAPLYHVVLDIKMGANETP